MLPLRQRSSRWPGSSTSASVRADGAQAHLDPQAGAVGVARIGVAQHDRPGVATDQLPHDRQPQPRAAGVEGAGVVEPAPDVIVGDYPALEVLDGLDHFPGALRARPESGVGLLVLEIGEPGALGIQVKENLGAGPPGNRGR